MSSQSGASGLRRQRTYDMILRGDIYDEWPCRVGGNKSRMRKDRWASKHARSREKQRLAVEGVG